MSRTSSILVATAVCLVVAGGVAAVAADDRPPEFSGFLDDYAGLRPASDRSPFLWGYAKRPLILREYAEAMIDPILIYFGPDAAGIGVDPEKLVKLTGMFREELIRELSKVREIRIVDEPGPGVMRVRIAVTDVEPVKGAANAGAKLAGAAAAGVGFLVPAVDVGGATMECEVVDSVTGERLVAVVDSDRGRRMFNFRGMKSLGDARGAIRGWATDFREELQRIHEGRLPGEPKRSPPDDR